MNLDVEKMLPDFIRRRFIIKKESLKPNEKRNTISKFFLDDTTLKRISNAVVADGNEVHFLPIKLKIIVSNPS